MENCNYKDNNGFCQNAASTRYKQRCEPSKPCIHKKSRLNWNSLIGKTVVCDDGRKGTIVKILDETYIQIEFGRGTFGVKKKSDVNP